MKRALVLLLIGMGFCVFVQGCAAPRPFIRPSDVSEAKFAKDQLHCERYSRGLGPHPAELRKPTPINTSSDLSAAMDGFMGGLARGVALAKIRRMIEARNLCMKSLGYSQDINDYADKRSKNRDKKRHPNPVQATSKTPLDTGWNELPEDDKYMFKLLYSCITMKRLIPRLDASPEHEMTPLTLEEGQWLLNAHDFLLRQIGIDPRTRVWVIIGRKMYSKHDLPEDVWKHLLQNEKTVTVHPEQFPALYQLICAGAYIQERQFFSHEKLKSRVREIRQLPMENRFPVKNW